MPAGPCPICGAPNSECADGTVRPQEMNPMAGPIYRSREKVYRPRLDIDPSGAVRELVFGIGAPIPLEEAIRQGILRPSSAEVVDTAVSYREAPAAGAPPLEAAVPSTLVVGLPDPPPEKPPVPEAPAAAPPGQAVTTEDFPQERTAAGAKRLPRRAR